MYSLGIVLSVVRLLLGSYLIFRIQREVDNDNISKTIYFSTMLLILMM